MLSFRESPEKHFNSVKDFGLKAAFRVITVEGGFFLFRSKEDDGKMNLISAKDAAHRLNISRGMLSRLIKSGRLGVYRIGDRTLFDEKILEEFKAAVFEPPRRNARAIAA